MKKLLALVLASALLWSCQEQEVQTYEENWESLSKKEAAPDWFQDGKLGIYTHWGPIARANKEMIPGVGWYGLYMYMNEGVIDRNTGEMVRDKDGNIRKSHVYEFHKKAYGDPFEFTYKDLIKLWEPNKFDAKEWAKYFKASGARFAGPVAVHHDNFAMWDSEVTPWNSMDMQGIDVTAELKREIEAEGMKLITSFHHAFTWKYWSQAPKADGSPETLKLYGSNTEMMNHDVDEAFLQQWYDMLAEVIDKYQPDVIWFDWWIENFPEEWLQKFMAYYYNQAEKWGKEVVVNYKNEAFPLETAVNDYERGRPNRIKPNFWMTDTSPGAWFHRANAQFKTDQEIVDILIDIVSKNGLMLLNVPPTPEGELPEDIKKLLLGMGAWLDINGEGIYETRPWKVFGEGPTRLPAGGHKVEKKKIVYTEKDIRFTKKGDSEVFAFVMAEPTEDIVIKSFASDLTLLADPIKTVTMLGSKEKVEWKQTEKGLIIKKPTSIPNDIAVGYKILLKGAKEIGIGGDQDGDGE